MSTLLERIQDWYKDESFPPDGYAGFELVSEKTKDILRWGISKTWVFTSDDFPGQFVAIDDVEPATEMQDWGDYGDPEIYSVEPREQVVTITTYHKI